MNFRLNSKKRFIFLVAALLAGAIAMTANAGYLVWFDQQNSGWFWHRGLTKTVSFSHKASNHKLPPRAKIHGVSTRAVTNSIKLPVQTKLCDVPQTRCDHVRSDGHRDSILFNGMDASTDFELQHTIPGQGPTNSGGGVIISSVAVYYLSAD